MPAPTIPGNSRLPPGAQMAMLVFWDTTLNAGDGGWAPATGASGVLGSSATLAGDIAIGAVELKNATTDDRASINASGELLTRTAAASAGAITSVNDTASSTTVLASNASRKAACFFNDSTAVLYLALANTTASTTVYSVQIPAGGYYELPVGQGGVYTGIVVGIWASDASGAVRVTEMT